MNKLQAALLGSVMLSGLLQGCVERKPVKSPIVTTEILDRDGRQIGTARVSENLQGGVNLVVDAAYIRTGEHGIHFHERGDCSSKTFTSAGGHINPNGKPHGLNHEDGPDNGDMPNAIADDDGIVSYAIFNKRVSMHGEGGLPALMDEDGSALVIHQRPDDQKTQPIGGAGPRIACAVIGGPLALKPEAPKPVERPVKTAPMEEPVDSDRPEEPMIDDAVDVESTPEKPDEVPKQ